MNQRMRHRPRYLAVVPAYNEAATVGGVVTAMRRHQPGFDLVVVDDGSTDETGLVAHAAGARVLRAPFNLGIGGAVQLGFVYALENDYDYLVQVDGDGQHDPGEIERLITQMTEDPTIDMVCGTTTNNLTRQRQVDFLSTIFITGNRILTRKDSGIKELEDLKGKRVTVNQGTSNEKIIKELDAKFKLGIRFLDTKDQPQGWIALETGRSDAHVTDEVVALGLIAKSKEPEKYATVGRLLSYDPYSIVVRRDDSAFRLVGNRVLADLFRSGEINAVYTKWMSTISMPMSDQMKIVFDSQAYPE